MQLNAQKIAELAGGKLSFGSNLTTIITQVSIDSRKITNNCLFVAIVGEKFDGHSFVADVLKEKTNFALVNNDFSLELPNLIKVADSTKALGTLAANYRQLFQLPIVAITGSNGKTTLKEMLKSVCQEFFGAEHVLATPGNLNNHLGVPLSLLGLNTQHKVAIIEMGMSSAGELDYLTNLTKPSLAIVNNVFLVHASQFNSLMDIAKAKGEIYHGLSRNAVACVDLSNNFSKMWLANDIHSQIFSYGTKDTNCYLNELTEDGASYHTPMGELLVKLQVLGTHNYYNALSVIALAINLTCSLESIKKGLEQYTGYAGRLERKKAFNGALIIDDSYNANPDSVKAALQAIQKLATPYWFIFADLKELGENELILHAQLGGIFANFKISKLLTVGNLAKYAADEFSGDKIHFKNNNELIEYCRANLPAQTTVLVKGSNSMQLGQVVAGLTNC